MNKNESHDYEVAAVYFEPFPDGDRITVAVIVSATNKDEQWQVFRLLTPEAITRLMGGMAESVNGLIDISIEDLSECLSRYREPAEWPPVVSGIGVSNCRIVEAINQNEAAKIFKGCFTFLDH